jgi:hypothetical protein
VAGRREVLPCPATRKILSLSPKYIIFDNQWNLSNVPAGSVGERDENHPKNGATV